MFVIIHWILVHQNVVFLRLLEFRHPRHDRYRARWGVCSKGWWRERREVKEDEMEQVLLNVISGLSANVVIKRDRVLFSVWLNLEW